MSYTKMNPFVSTQVLIKLTQTAKSVPKSLHKHVILTITLFYSIFEDKKECVYIMLFIIEMVKMFGGLQKQMH